MIPDFASLPGLLPGHVHLHLARFQDWVPQKETFRSTLNKDELQRLGRYKITAKAEQFLCSRGLLRWLLGGYLQEDPAAIDLQLNSAGKPYLSGVPVVFNLSHSGDYVLLGVGHVERIGVDIQETYPFPNMATAVNNYFGAREKAYLASQDRDIHLAQFFEIWSAKEAYLKALGKGFVKSPQSFDMLPNPDPERTFRLLDPAQPDGNPAWIVQKLRLPAGYQGAVAVNGELQEIQQFPLIPGAAS